ncbi:hypothetical protein JYU34_002725, partial [Plutella xylostella]
AAAAQEPLEPITLEEVVSGQYSQRGFNGRWISDTEFTYTVPGEAGIYMFDMTTLNSSVLVSAELLAFLNTTSPILSADRKFILAPSEVESVYRYSTTAKYALYEIAEQSVTYIADQQRLQLCIFGGGHSLAYVLDNDLYYLPEGAAAPVRITTDGVPDVLYNGHTDWVYEEDVMYTGQATWFSTDGSYLAFASFNDEEVDTYSYYYYVDQTEDEDGLYPKFVNLKYPKVGRKNPTVSLRVVNLATLSASSPVTWTTLLAPAEVTDDHILGAVTWPTDNEVAAYWFNRRQNSSILRICNVVTDFCQDEAREEPNGWIAMTMPVFSSAGDYYMSLRWGRAGERGGWQQLHQTLRGEGGLVTESITPGEFTVDNFVGMDEGNNRFYYTRTLTGAPWRRQVYVTTTAGESCLSCDVTLPDGGICSYASASLSRGGRYMSVTCSSPDEPAAVYLFDALSCLSCDVTLPDGGICSYASASLSRGGRYMSVTCSSPDEPAAVYLFDALNERNLYTWETNAIVRERLAGKAVQQKIITTVPLDNGHPAPVRLLLPPGLDVNDTNTKYPVMFYVYSGPNTNRVFDTFTATYHSYITTSRNMVFLEADGRGAGLNGRDNLFAVNNALGTVEMTDHIHILKEVLSRYPFLDADRVAIYGHSYGGYAALLTMIYDDENVFKCAVSGAPVTSWLYYNTMYTERYMGVPTEEDNLAGYQAGDVTLLADKLNGKDFYIMHGNADDNVHYQNAAKLMRALQLKDIPFQQMSYPDEAHSLNGVSLHRYNTMDRYLDRCLNMM